MGDTPSSAQQPKIAKPSVLTLAVLEMEALAAIEIRQKAAAA
jgi:hypothetical protein